MTGWVTLVKRISFHRRKTDADSHRAQPWTCSQPPSDDKGSMRLPLTASSQPLLADRSVVLSSALGHKLLHGLFSHFGTTSQTPTVFSSVLLKVGLAFHQRGGKKAVSNSWQYRESNESSTFEISKMRMCAMCQVLFCTAAFFKVKVLVARSCLAVCDLMDCSPPGSSVHGLSRQGYWSVLPFPSPGHLSNPSKERESLKRQAHSLPSEPPDG